MAMVQRNFGHFYDARKFPKYDFINKWFRMFQERGIARPQASGCTNRLEAALDILITRSRRKIRRRLSWRLVVARGARRVRGCTCKRVRSYRIAIKES